MALRRKPAPVGRAIVVPVMIDPTVNDIGRTVLYKDRDLYIVERGVITSFNESYVFVQYGTDPFSKATRRRDLDWPDEKPVAGESKA